MNTQRSVRPREMGGFTLIEIMVVVVIIGLLVGIIAPNVMERLGRAETGAAEAEIKTITTALDFFRMDHYRYPTQDEGLEILRGDAEVNGKPVAEHLQTDPVDPWGRPYVYVYPGTHGGDYDVYTLGADGEEGGEGPTSDPGISGKRGLPGRGAQSRGFSLLEIMVVVAIIGIFVGVTVLSTDLVSFERRLEQEARRIGTILSFAADEALLQSQDFGLLICEDGYHFFIFNYEIEDWIPYAVRPFDGHMLDDDMLLTLRLDDAEVVLETTAEAYPRDLARKAPSRASRRPAGRRHGDLDQLPDPQIVILSSGEVTPFELGFLRESDLYAPGVTLEVAFDGEYEVVRDAE